MTQQAVKSSLNPPTSSAEIEQESARISVPAPAALSDRQPRTLKQGDTFGVFDRTGDIFSAPGSSDGLYHYDTRYLSQLLLTLNGARPLLLSSTLRDDNAAFSCYDVLEREISITLRFSADFADLFEVRGTGRLRHGEHLTPKLRSQACALAYRGLDGIVRKTHLQFDPQPRKLTENSCLYDLSLKPHHPEFIYFKVKCDGDFEAGETRRSYLVSLRQAKQFLSASRRAASIATSNETFNECVRRSVSDLYMLRTETEYGSYPYAGIPWFSTVFGRDALITALQMLWMDPSIAKGVLLFLAAHQATGYDEVADAEPGKILHEMRKGEMANLGEVPFRHYYGSIDSTPLFLMLAGAYLERTDDIATIDGLWPNIESAFRWIEQDGDRDGDGFVEYGRRNANGLINQGWKDSHDSIFHADGAIAEGPIALAEVQAYVYGALTALARIAKRLDKAELASSFEAKAHKLKEQFDLSFYDAELETYAIAIDGQKRKCRIRSSNAGHVLFTGLAKEERLPVVVATLMGTSSFSGWGVRTVASTEVRYNPMSYHNGSVWPHDNALIAAGLERYGYRHAALRIFEGMFAAATYLDLRRLPELFCGFPRRRGQGPTFYPVACSPQAWAAATPLFLMQTCLGLRFSPRERQIELRQPLLPAFLSEVVLRQIRLGESMVDIEARRIRSETAVNVVQRSGEIRVLVIN
jgi:glycogen debranching enzyme